MTKYWIIRNGESVGPIEADRLVAEHITANTKVWRKGMTGWTAASLVPELASQFSQTKTLPPPLPVSAVVPPADSSAKELVRPTDDELAAETDEEVTATSGRCPYTRRVAAIVVSAIAVVVLCGTSPWKILLDPFFLLILPFCGMSIVSSVKTSKAWKQGNIKKARRLSQRTYLWIVLTIVATLVLLPFHLVASMFF